jgi:fimbrial chaperone protein
VAQLPVKLSGEQAGIQILYNFEVLISVGPQGVKPAMRIASASLVRNNAGESVPLIRLANESATYGYLSRGQLHIIARNAEGAVSLSRVLSGGELQQTLGMGLVASGQTRDFVVPIILPADTVAVEARFVPGR